MSLYYLAAAVTGFLTLGIEMVAGRVLAPYLGSSLHQWAALIGVVLLAYIGGYSAFQRLTRWGAAPVLVAAGTYVLIFPLWGFWALEGFLQWPLAAASIASAALVAGMPSFLWAALLPYFQAQAGKNGSARVLAWGSAGNLVGAWSIAFLAVPEMGTRLTWLGLGAASIALAAALFFLSRAPRGGVRGKRARAAAAGMIAVAVGGASWRLAHWSLPVPASMEDLGTGSEVLADRESAYQRIRVWEREYSGHRYRMLSLNQTVQFFWDREQPWVAGEPYTYYNWSALLAGLGIDGKSTLRSGLFLGVGGGLVPWQIRKLLGRAGEVAMPRMLALELDGEVAKAAQEFLPLGEAGPVEVRVGDARQLMRQANEKFEYVLADTFLNSYVPFHLTTREFFENAREHLVEGGLLVVNLHTVFSLTGLLGEIEATIASVFPNALALEIEAGTTLLLATTGLQPLRERLEAATYSPHLGPDLRSELTRMLARARELEVGTGDGILTDDRNDTEQRLYETRRFLVMRRGM